MKSSKALAFVFALAFVLGPAVILLHECGHYIVYRLHGLHAVIYSSMIWPSGSIPSRSGRILAAAGGPMVEASLGVTGFLWLRQRRQRCPEAPPKGLDWLATGMALCGGRSVLQALTGLPNRYATGDEAGLSRLLGLPGWVLPLTLFLPATWLLVATVRQHPRSLRLVPFSVALLGGGSGGLLWLLVVGPALLGQQSSPWRLWRLPALPPKVVFMQPANGATNVAPGLTELRLTFDHPMTDSGWILPLAGSPCPEPVGPAHYDRTRTVWTIPVRLSPDRDYAFLLNPDQYKGFVSLEGVALDTVLVRFGTSSAATAP